MDTRTEWKVSLPRSQRPISNQAVFFLGLIATLSRGGDWASAVVSASRSSAARDRTTSLLDLQSISKKGTLALPQRVQGWANKSQPNAAAHPRVARRKNTQLACIFCEGSRAG